MMTLVGRWLSSRVRRRVTPALPFPEQSLHIFPRLLAPSMLRRFLFAFIIVIWLSVVSCGMALVWSYNHRPGEAAAAPARWPADTHVPRANGYTLVMLAHPKCPCTRATVEE